MLNAIDSDFELVEEKSSSPQNNVAIPRTRKYFPETWIWDCVCSRFVVMRYFRKYHHTTHVDIGIHYLALLWLQNFALQLEFSVQC